MVIETGVKSRNRARVLLAVETIARLADNWIYPPDIAGNDTCCRGRGGCSDSPSAWI